MKLFKIALFFVLSSLGLAVLLIGSLQLNWTKEKIRTTLLSRLKEQGIDASIGAIKGDLPFKLTLYDISLPYGEIAVKIESLRMRVALLPLLRKELSFSYIEGEGFEITYPEEAPLFLKFVNKGSFQASFSGPWTSWLSLLKGSPCPRPIKGSLRADLPEGFFITSFTMGENSLFSLKNLSLKSDILCLKGDLSFDFMFHPQNAALSFLFPHLSKINSHLQGILEGIALYHHSNLTLSLESRELSIHNLLYTQARGSLHATHQNKLWSGSLDFHATHPDLPLDLQALFTSSAHLFSLEDFSCKIADTEIGGHGIFSPLDFSQTDGSCFIHSPNLSLFLPLFPHTHLSGSLAANISLKGSLLTFYGAGQSLQWEKLLSSQLCFNGCVNHLFSSPLPDINIEGLSTYWDQFLFESFKLELAQEYKLSARGFWKDQFNFSSSGKVVLDKHSLELELFSLKGNLLAKSFELQKNCSLKIEQDLFFLEELDLNFNDGYLQASFDSSLSKMSVKATHFPIDILALFPSRFSLQGSCSLDIACEGKEARGSILLEKADILQAGKKIPLQSKGALQISLHNGIVQLNTSLHASHRQFLELNATLPVFFHLFPFQFHLEQEKPFTAELSLDGHLEDIFDFINIGSGTATGLISCHLLGSKTLASPFLQGTLEIQNGSYQNYLTGMFFKEIYAQATAEQDHLYFSSIQAKDLGKGDLSGTGALSFKRGTTFSFSALINQLKMLELDWLSLYCSGPIHFSGNSSAVLIKGDLVVSKADITMPDDLPVEFPLLEVKYINQPSYLKKTRLKKDSFYTFNYDIFLKTLKLKNSPPSISLSGRGLTADLEGKLHFTGQNLSIDAEGSLNLIKGRFSFAGKDFTLTQGELTFVKTPSPQGYLNLSGTLSIPDLTVTALLKGPLTAPILTFQSTPMLPTSSILAHILFNKDISELSATQALQLADTIITLSGNAGPSILEKIRKTLGIDRLNIISYGDLDEIKVQVGKYLTKGVLVTLSQGAESSQVIVEVELKGGFIFQAENQEDDQGKFTLKWNKNY